MRSALILSMLGVILLAGCGGLGPPVPTEPTAAIAVIDAVDANTNEPIAVEAVAIVGGVRGNITLAEGSVVLRDVPFGTATPPQQPLTVTAPGYVTFAEPIQLSVTVATFYTASLRPADVNETGTVRGTITSNGGAPVPNALVKFTQIGPGGATDVRGYTDNNGQYLIGGIPIGQNTVTAEAEGFITTSTQANIVQDAGGGQNPDVNLELLSGTTRIDITGIVVDAFSDQPIAGARVQFAGLDAVTTNAQGEFAINNIQVGAYAVTVTATGYDDYSQQVSVLPGMGRQRFPLTPSAPQPPGGPYNLQGTVTLNGAPDNSGATVTAVATATGATVERVTTPASGEYTMFLPPGEYRITASFGGRSVGRTVDVPGGGRILTGIDFVLTVTP